jgi:hypothetical protein
VLFPVWGTKTTEILWIFATKKIFFAYFASKLKILSLKNAIKALQLCYFRFGGQKPS